MSQRPLIFIIPIPNPLSSLLLCGRRVDCVGDGRTVWETGGQVRPPLHTTAESVCVIPCHSEPSPQTGRGNPFSAPTGAVLPPYAPSDAPRERPLPLPLGEVAERSEGGEGKQRSAAPSGGASNNMSFTAPSSSSPAPAATRPGRSCRSATAPSCGW